MLRLTLIITLFFMLSACVPSVTPADPPTAVPTVTPAPVDDPGNDQTIIDVDKVQTVDGVTVSIASLVSMPQDSAMLEALDPGGHSFLFDGFPHVGYISVTVENSSGATVDLYPATFGHVIIDGEQIDLVSYQFFADGDALDTTIMDGASKSADIWFPITDAQFAALESGEAVSIVFTDGVAPVYNFDVSP